MNNPWVCLALVPLVIQLKGVGMYRVALAVILTLCGCVLNQTWLITLAATGMMLCIEGRTEIRLTILKACLILALSVWQILDRESVLPLAILAGIFPCHILLRDIFLRLRGGLAGCFGFLYLTGVFEAISRQDDFSTWLLASGIYLSFLSIAQKDVRAFMSYRLLALFGLVAAQSQSPYFLLLLWLIEFGIWLCSSDDQWRFMSKKMPKTGLYILLLCGLCYLPIWPIYDSFFDHTTSDWFRLFLISLLAFGPIFTASRALAGLQDNGNT